MILLTKDEARILALALEGYTDELYDNFQRDAGDKLRDALLDLEARLDEASTDYRHFSATSHNEDHVVVDRFRKAYELKKSNHGK